MPCLSNESVTFGKLLECLRFGQNPWTKRRWIVWQIITDLQRTRWQRATKSGVTCSLARSLFQSLAAQYHASKAYLWVESFDRES